MIFKILRGVRREQHSTDPRLQENRFWLIRKLVDGIPWEAEELWKAYKSLKTIYQKYSSPYSEKQSCLGEVENSEQSSSAKKQHNRVEQVQATKE